MCVCVCMYVYLSYLNILKGSEIRKGFIKKKREREILDIFPAKQYITYSNSYFKL